ncbi:MAG: hypothetical protein NVS9B3_16020 [Gemmatimonadaceae bacterium]
MELTRAISRAENAPLAASYRALALTGTLRNDPAVKALADSLADIERVRDAFGALGGVDPIFVALTGRATVVGRAIQAIAVAKRAALRHQIASMRAPELPPDSAALASAIRRREAAIRDTLALTIEVASRQATVRATRTGLENARTVVAALDRRALRARELASTNAPPWALLAASLVFGFACGFAAVFVDEVRHPRVGDTGELGRLTQAPSLAVQLPSTPPPELARRRADRELPPLLNWRAEDYQLLYLQLVERGGTLLFATVTGDDPGITAAIAVNLAAAAVRQARTAVVADVDVHGGVVADVLRVRRTPGVREIVTTSRSWAEAIVTAQIGRELTLDIVPAGQPGTVGVRDLSAHLAPELARLSRRYDAVVVTCSLDQALNGLPATLPVADLILCVRAGHTLVRDVAGFVEGLRVAGGRLRSGVLWEGDAPTPRTADLAVSAETAELLEVGEGGGRG